jgi:hypothetical protein
VTAASDLTSLAAVKAWLGDTVTTSDAQISGLITSVSRAIYSALQRTNILPATYSEVLNGTGRYDLVLKSFPVISISSLTMDGITVPVAPALPNWPATGYGYVLETVDPIPPGRPANLYMRGRPFRRGLQNVSVSYVAGYQVSETQTIASGTLTALAPYGAWGTDQGVVYASTGVALTAVSGTPAQGQYKVSAGAYTFNAADNAASVTLSYGFIPADLAQAAIEWTAARFKAQSYIGLKSKSLGGQETISYDTGAMPAFISAAIQPYKRVTFC